MGYLTAKNRPRALLLSVQCLSAKLQLFCSCLQKLVGFDQNCGVEFEYLISNFGFGIDSVLGEVLVLVSIFT